MIRPHPDHAHRPFTHHGPAASALALGASNLLYNLCTLFLWRFWGKTRVRRLLWSATTAWGDPLDYTGSGRELFVGFLLVLVAVFLPLSGLFSFAGWLNVGGNPLGAVLAGTLQLVIAVLAGAGLYRARRYQLSRTVWRGIRAGQGGSALHYGLMWLQVVTLSGLTLGWAWPWGEMKLAAYRLRHATFGGRPFTCTATAGSLYGRFALLWLLFVLIPGGGIAAFKVIPLLVTMGVVHAFPGTKAMFAVSFALFPVLVVITVLAWFSYRAAFYRRLAEATAFGHVRFSFPAEPWAMLRLTAGNLLIVACTLGIGYPLALMRTFRFTCDTLHVHGEPDFAAISQDQAARPRFGEGLAAMFDGAGEF